MPDLEPARAATEVEDESVVCYVHTNTPTRLRCSRCDRPICGRCAIPASVGQHCPDCVAEARRSSPKVRGVTAATAPVVTAIIVANIIVYIGQLAAPIVTARFASFPPAIADGEYYRLLTSMFLHSPSTIFHIVFNMYVLWAYGAQVEQAFGSFRFAVLYTAAGFGGSALSFAFGSCGTSSVGASGAIFGVVGALVVFLYRRRNRAFVGPYLRGLIMFVGLNLMLGFLPQIDGLAHAGGLIAGAALGAVLDEGRTRPSVPQIVGTAAVVAVAAALVVWRAAGFVCIPGS